MATICDYRPEIKENIVSCPTRRFCTTTKFMNTKMFFET
jgi:hypothetical protein